MIRERVIPSVYGFSRFGEAASTRRRHRWLIPEAALRWGWPPGLTPRNPDPMVNKKRERNLSRPFARLTGFTNP